MIIVPNKKLYRVLWLLLGSLFVFLFYLIFHLLAGDNRILTAIGILITLFSIVSLYIKSILNYFEVVVKGNDIFIYQFGKLFDSAPIKKCVFFSDYTDTGKKQYKRILFEINQKKIILTNFEHIGYDEFHGYLQNKKLLKKGT